MILLTPSSLWSLHKQYIEKMEGLFSKTYIPLGVPCRQLCWTDSSLKTWRQVYKRQGYKKICGYRQCPRTAVKQTLHISILLMPNIQKLSWSNCHCFAEVWIINQLALAKNKTKPKQKSNNPKKPSPPQNNPKTYTALLFRKMPTIPIHIYTSIYTSYETAHKLKWIAYCLLSAAPWF